MIGAVLEESRATFDATEAIRAALRAKRTEATLAVEEIPAGEVLKWNVTPEQIARINAGDRAAIDEFFFEAGNYKHISACAGMFYRDESYLRAVISAEDLINQFYVDLRMGVVKLRPWTRAINRACFTSFRYAAVGGLDEIYIPFLRERPL